MAILESPIVGHAFQIRSVAPGDASLVIDLRADGTGRSRYLNPIDPSAESQINWIAAQRNRPGDFYFVVENLQTGVRDGLIGLYDISEGRAEWGRWIIREGSLATLESVLLIGRLAFNTFGLDEVYCRTKSKNTAVVNFHDSLGARRRETPGIQLNAEPQQPKDYIEHFITFGDFRNSIEGNLDVKCSRLAKKW